LRDPTFSRFSTVPACDRQTDRQTDGHTTTSGVTERLGALGHSDTLGPNLSWALAGYNI